MLKSINICTYPETVPLDEVFAMAGMQLPPILGKKLDEAGIETTATEQ